MARYFYKLSKFVALKTLNMEKQIQDIYNNLLSLNTNTSTFIRGDVKEVYFFLGGKTYGYAMFYYGKLQDSFKFN